MPAGIFERLGSIALVGGGRMGEAIIKGLVQGALLDPEYIEVVEPTQERCTQLAQTYNISCVTQAQDLSPAHTVILAVKPQVLKEVAQNLAAQEGFAPQRVISIAAGITTQTLADIFPHTHIIRVMPNAPLCVSTGMSVVAVAQDTPLLEGNLVVELFSLMGEAVLIDEDQIDAATALSGSGPAYFALLAEELSNAGVSVGLSPQQAQQMATQTLIGTAKQLLLTSETPRELRNAVTSPGGTTQAAVESLEANDFGTMIKQAVEAAIRRAQELA